MSFSACQFEALVVFAEQPVPVPCGGAGIPTSVANIDDIRSHLVKEQVKWGCLVTILTGRAVGPLKLIIASELAL